MKIVFIRSNSVMPDPRVEKEVNSLLKYGHQIRILSWDRQNDSGNNKNGELVLSNGKVPIRWFLINSKFGNGIKTLGALLLFQLSLFIWLIKHNKEYEVIHACDFDTSIPARVCSKIFKKKLVYDIFDYYIESFQVPRIIKPVIERIDIGIINSADAVVITNESRLIQIKKSKPNRIIVIHNSPDSDRNSTKEIQFIGNKDKIKIVYIGILSSNRLLLEVMEIISKKNDIELHIGGFGPYENQVKDFSSKYENIYFYGKLPYDQVLSLEEKCDIMFAVYNPDIPNHRYSSPNKLYEAMSLGKPIIVAKKTGIDEIIDYYKIGKSINYNGESFENAITELIMEKTDWENVSLRSQELYDKMYSWDKMDLRLKELYESL